MCSSHIFAFSLRLTSCMKQKMGTPAHTYSCFSFSFFRKERKLLHYPQLGKLAILFSTKTWQVLQMIIISAFDFKLLGPSVFRYKADFDFYFHKQCWYFKLVPPNFPSNFFSILTLQDNHRELTTEGCLFRLKASTGPQTKDGYHSSKVVDEHTRNY